MLVISWLADELLVSQEIWSLDLEGGNTFTHARSTLYAVQATSAKFGLRTGKMEFHMHNEEYKYLHNFTSVFVYTSRAIKHNDNNRKDIQ